MHIIERKLSAVEPHKVASLQILEDTISLNLGVLEGVKRSRGLFKKKPKPLPRLRPELKDAAGMQHFTGLNRGICRADDLSAKGGPAHRLGREAYIIGAVGFVDVRSLDILVERCSGLEDAKVVREAAPTVLELKCIVTVPEGAVYPMFTLKIIRARYCLVAIVGQLLQFVDVKAVSGGGGGADQDGNCVVLAERFGLRMVGDLAHVVVEPFAVALAKENAIFVHHDPKGNKGASSTILHTAAGAAGRRR